MKNKCKYCSAPAFVIAFNGEAVCRARYYKSIGKSSWIPIDKRRDCNGKDKEKVPGGRISVSDKKAFDDSTLTPDAVLRKIMNAYMRGIKRCQKQVLLTTGLRKVVSVDEFDLADSGDETSGGSWLDEARKGAERTGTWSKDNIGKSLGKEFELGGDMSSLDPDSKNPFGG